MSVKIASLDKFINDTIKPVLRFQRTQTYYFVWLSLKTRLVLAKLHLVTYNHRVSNNNKPGLSTIDLSPYAREFVLFQ